MKNSYLQAYENLFEHIYEYYKYQWINEQRSLLYDLYTKV